MPDQPPDPPAYEDDDDPLDQAVSKHGSLINSNAIYLNAVTNILVAKGLVTREEIRVHYLRELAEFDRVQARYVDSQSRQFPDAEADDDAS